MVDCKVMDSLSVTLLQSMDDLVKKKVEMEKCLSEGFILMAKSKMILGKERVSMMQFPTNDEERMTARYCVYSESSDEEILPLEEKIKSSLKLDSSDDVKKPQGTMQLRHRKCDKKLEAAKNDEEAISYSVEQDKLVLSKKSEVDPLKWFGVLVPQELKLAQKTFEKSLSLSVDCANIQKKIEKIKEAIQVAKTKCAP